MELYNLNEDIGEHPNLASKLLGPAWVAESMEAVYRCNVADGKSKLRSDKVGTNNCPAKNPFTAPLLFACPLTS